MPSWPVRWYYDVLRGLDYLRLARPDGDPRAADAVALLRAKADTDGLFRLENTHEGPRPFAEEREFEGFPARGVEFSVAQVS